MGVAGIQERIDLAACRTYVKQLLSEEYVTQLRSNSVRADDIRPPFDADMLDIIKSLEELARKSGNARHVKTRIDDLINRSPAFAALFEKKKNSHAEEEHIIGIPELPPDIKAQENLANQASPILDAMIEYSKYWATRSYEGYHEAVALWVLSTIAARRVYLPWRKGVWTNLYIVLVSDSTVNAKTEAASYGKHIIEQCGLGFLLAPDDISPEKWVSKMSGNIYSIPRNYSLMNEKEREWLRLKLTFSAQKGWVYDEFGDFLQEIIKSSSSSRKFYKLLKQLYDNKTTFIYETHARGEETASMPYLSLLGTTPPDSLKPIASDDSAVWTDGAFARMAWIVSPDKKPRLQSAPDGEAHVPETIRQALVAWHERLGIPTCEIIDLTERAEQQEEADKYQGKKQDRKIKDGPSYLIEKGDLPQNPIYWTNSGVREAQERYYGALATLAHEHDLSGAFKATYGRLPTMALSIAMLLASLENDGRMDMRHWARGQAITERWRANFHELVHQISNGETGGYGALENAIIDVLTKKIAPGEKVSARGVYEKGNQFIRNAGTPKIRTVLEELHSTEVISRDGKGKSALYWIEKQPMQG
jgi:hypothetical protein